MRRLSGFAFRLAGRVRVRLKGTDREGTSCGFRWWVNRPIVDLVPRAKLGRARGELLRVNPDDQDGYVDVGYSTLLQVPRNLLEVGDAG